MTSQTVSLSKELISRLEDRSSKTNFGSVEEYIEFCLEEILHELDDPADADDLADVSERLESLGYVE